MTSRPRRNVVHRLDHAITWCEYSLFLPFLARLPLRLGYRLAAWRGKMNWAFDREWRSIAVGHPYIRGATGRAINQILPDLPASGIEMMTRRRFEGFSREEFEAQLLMKKRVGKLHFMVRGIEGVQQQLARGRGMVLLTPHFDSFILGMVFLGMSGLTVNVMTSDVVENPRVDRCVRRFFFRKYRCMETYLQGGKALHVEQDLRFFYRALLAGESVVILADLPTPTPGDHPMWLRFLGRERSFLSGAFRLARRTGSAVAGFVCRWEGAGNYTVTLGECIPPDGVTHESYQRTYNFLESAIRSNPERWFAADLLQVFENR